LPHLRSPEDIDKSLGQNFIPDGTPRGTWASDAQAKLDIEGLCKNMVTEGGGWGCVWGSLRAANKRRGMQHVLKCHKHGSPSNCKWKIVLEMSTIGWIVRDITAGHNQALIQKLSESKAIYTMRGIPFDLLDIGRSMKKAGIHPAQIRDVLEYKVRSRGEEVRFNYKDVYDTFALSTQQRLLDATNFVEELLKREMDRGLFYHTTKDDSGCLKNVFFILDKALETYSVGIEQKVVLFDTKVC
jgi:hypothetical protein